MSTQLSPQLIHCGIPTLEASFSLQHLFAPADEDVSMPVGGQHLGRILGQVGPEQFHGLELVGHCHLGQWEIDRHRQRAPNPLLT